MNGTKWTVNYSINYCVLFSRFFSLLIIIYRRQHNRIGIIKEMVTSDQLYSKIFRELIFSIITFYLLDDNIDVVLSVGSVPIIINNAN